MGNDNSSAKGKSSAKLTVSSISTTLTRPVSLIEIPATSATNSGSSPKFTNNLRPALSRYFQIFLGCSFDHNFHQLLLLKLIAFSCFFFCCYCCLLTVVNFIYLFFFFVYFIYQLGKFLKNVQKRNFVNNQRCIAHRSFWQ